MKDDEWSDELRVLGNNLGRFIYLLDAYDDLEKMRKRTIIMYLSIIRM